MVSTWSPRHPERGEGWDFERFLTAGWRVRATQHSGSVRESAAGSSLWMSDHLRDKPLPARESSRQEKRVRGMTIRLRRGLRATPEKTGVSLGTRKRPIWQYVWEGIMSERPSSHGAGNEERPGEEDRRMPGAAAAGAMTGRTETENRLLRNGNAHLRADSVVLRTRYHAGTLYASSLSTIQSAYWPAG